MLPAETRSIPKSGLWTFSVWGGPPGLPPDRLVRLGVNFLERRFTLLELQFGIWSLDIFRVCAASGWGRQSCRQAGRLTGFNPSRPLHSRLLLRNSSEAQTPAPGFPARSAPR